MRSAPAGTRCWPSLRHAHPAELPSPGVVQNDTHQYAALVSSQSWLTQTLCSWVSEWLRDEACLVEAGAAALIFVLCGPPADHVGSEPGGQWAKVLYRRGHHAPLHHDALRGMHVSR